MEQKQVKYSIVIPSYNHLTDCLIPCVAAIKKYTDLRNAEVIVVANGCTDGTKEYLEYQNQKESYPWFHYVWYDEGLGFAKAANEGIKASVGEYIILLNNDAFLLEQPINDWINKLEEPFKDPKVGITGPLKLYDKYAGERILIFFCVIEFAVLAIFVPKLCASI